MVKVKLDNWLIAREFWQLIEPKISAESNDRSLNAPLIILVAPVFPENAQWQGEPDAAEQDPEVGEFVQGPAAAATQASRPYCIWR